LLSPDDMASKNRERLVWNQVRSKIVIAYAGSICGPLPPPISLGPHMSFIEETSMIFISQLVNAREEGIIRDKPSKIYTTYFILIRL